MTSEREHWLSITDDPEWRRNHIADPNIPLDETLAAITEAFPTNPKRILEIGCGYGRLATQIAAQYPRAWVTGIDVNPDVLPKEEPGNRITYLCRDNLWNLPRESHHPNAIYSVAVFQHLPEHEKRDYIFDAASILRPGGVLRIQFIDGDRDNFVDHWTPCEIMEIWMIQAGLGVSAIDVGLAHHQWTWITGVK